MKKPTKPEQTRRLTGISLFASSGVGDLSLRAVGVEVLVANEYLSDRAELFRSNHPECEMIQGDIRELSDTVVATAKRRLGRRRLDVLFATPPCQGMSKNGRGKLLRGVRDGMRESLDPRNQLATFVPPIINQLKPKMVVFENVPEMDGTLVEDSDGSLIELLDLLCNELPDYIATWRVIEFADYGVPQRRQRLITFFLRKDVARARNIRSADDLANAVFPEATHSNRPTLLQEPWICVNDVIGDLPPLDARCKETAESDIEFHHVPLLDEKKYWWVSNTPPGASAFDNQCIERKCRSKRNERHGSSSASGINQANKDTPIYCIDCGALLPRPTVEQNGQLRVMKGFTSAYKRMRGDLPAAALTRNLSYVSSDQKVHPTQHRVLSLLEAMRLHTITDFRWVWKLPNGKPVSDKLIRETIGESIPPRGLKIVLNYALTNTLR